MVQANQIELLNFKDVESELLTDLEMMVEESVGRVESGVFHSLMPEWNQLQDFFQNLIFNALKLRGEELLLVQVRNEVNADRQDLRAGQQHRV